MCLFGRDSPKHVAGTLTQSQTGKWLPAKQPSSRPPLVQGWNPRMLDQAGALESPGTDSTSSFSPDFGGTRRSRRRHKKRSKRAAQLLAESLDSAAEPRNSPEDYAGSQAGFQSVHSILHPDSPGESASPSEGFGYLAQSSDWQAGAGDGRTAQGGAGLEGFLHAARSGQGGLFQAEAKRRVSQDSSGVSPVHLLVHAFLNRPSHHGVSLV